MNSGNFDKVAWYYDALGRLVFGGALEDAQRYLLGFLPQHGRMLVAGGGSGWILEAVAACRQGLEIVYVEASAEMLRLARKRRFSPNEVVFVHGLIEEYHSEAETFDAVLTPFLFDLFTDEAAFSLYRHLLCMLKPGGAWLYADFVQEQDAPGWQRLLLAGMYRFFRITTGLKAVKLPDFKGFESRQLELTASRKFYAGFVKAAAYTKRRQPAGEAAFEI